MDITKLDEYEGDRMKEAIEWAKDQRDAGKFLWNRCIPELGDPIPYSWTTKEGTTWEDHSRMIEIADFYQEVKQFKAKCHEFFKGHRLREEADGEGGTRCTTCLAELSDNAGSIPIEELACRMQADIDEHMRNAVEQGKD